MKNIAILLTVFNRKEKTLACLESIEQSGITRIPSSFDIFLVDDGSTDGTADAVKKQFPKVHLIEGTGNLFWNRGMHKAWQEASKTKDYDFFMWMNDDTVLLANAINLLLETSSQFSDHNIIVGSTCAMNDSQIITYGGRKTDDQLIEPQDSPISCEFFNGNIVLIPRDVYQKVGMNDPFFHHALGDFDYGKRAAKLGVKSIVAPGVLGRCDEHESLSTWCDPQKPFSKRWKAFRSPLGQHPEEFFVYEKRHNGFLMACFHYFTNHLRVVWPQIWNQRNKARFA